MARPLIDLRPLWVQTKPRRAVKPLRETSDAYYYRFPKGRYYVIRWLRDGGYHFYPPANGRLPKGFPSRKSAEKHGTLSGDFKVVTSRQASRYPVPKRY